MEGTPTPPSFSARANDADKETNMEERRKGREAILVLLLELRSGMIKIMDYRCESWKKFYG